MDAALAARHDALSAVADRLRSEAADLRDALRRFGDDPAEPSGLRPDAVGEGFEQPPHPGREW